MRRFKEDRERFARDWKGGERGCRGDVVTYLRE